MHKHNSISALILLIVLITGCHQLYWQRNKIRVGSKYRKQKVEILIENTTPKTFDANFDRELLEACKNEFKRIGAIVDFEENPDYTAIVTIKLDSFNIKGTYAITSGKGSSWHMYRKDHVKAILSDYKVFDTKRKVTNWAQQNDIYYFENETRNTRRSINMIKYTFRYGM